MTTPLPNVTSAPLPIPPIDRSFAPAPAQQTRRRQWWSWPSWCTTNSENCVCNCDNCDSDCDDCDDCDD